MISKCIISIYYSIRGRKHVLELEKMCTTKHDAKHTNSDYYFYINIFFKEQSCSFLYSYHNSASHTYPMDEFYVILIDNSTTFGVLKLGTLHSISKKSAFLTGAWLEE